MHGCIVIQVDELARQVILPPTVIQRPMSDHLDRFLSASKIRLLEGHLWLEAIKVLVQFWRLRS